MIAHKYFSTHFRRLIVLYIHAYVHVHCVRIDVSSGASYRVQGARNQREAQIRVGKPLLIKKALIVHSLKYKSMIICTLAAYRALPSYVHGLIVLIAK